MGAIAYTKHPDILQFISALSEAEEKKEHEFCCPLCGGVAEWYRSEYNNHIHAWCNGCGMKMME